MWVVVKRQKFIYYSEWKYWPSLPLHCLKNLHADFLLYFSGITKQEYNLLRSDPVHVIEHRLLVAGFSPWRWLVLNIFRADNSCIHQISHGLLIGSVTLLILAPLCPYLVPQGWIAWTRTSYSSSSLPVPHPAGLNSSDPDSIKCSWNLFSVRFPNFFFPKSLIWQEGKEYRGGKGKERKGRENWKFREGKDGGPPWRSLGRSKQGQSP
jgi:hypothetical protein